ncbi:FAD-dependent oxidoreductase [Halarsenatibacter silvermanii]|uniref:Alkyl hydroperoxide reductase subunit F n=1 Tax=Halarsenatibacter silvermanii TaxID=321763 RepID=A0A1G9KRF5_9FIRM|nr:FAD-dependent oxidoreductase [Halarsenatibacter silvermanii]SDL52196.1 alkyl hydroperoxide reductase subunit F [Halarsenatibacter silvermanii]
MTKSCEIEIYALEWCPYCEKAKALIKSKGFSYKEYDIGEEEVEEEMQERTDGAKTVPQVFIDGHLVGGYDDLVDANISGELNDLLGIEEEADYFDKTWDLITVGAGPASFNAALYAARKGLEVLIIGKDMGGQMLESGEIDNYLGFQDTDGADLIQAFWLHVQKYDVDIMLGDRVSSIEEKKNQSVTLELSSGNTAAARAAILATGAESRELNVTGEKQFKGKGVHYCATCDGYLYSGKDVAIVGGGNSGLEASLDLAKLDCSVELIEVEPELTGDDVLIRKVEANKNINIHTGTGVEEIFGQDKVEGLEIMDLAEKETGELSVEGIFIEIGYKPNSEYAEGSVEINEHGEIIIDENNCTSAERIWAAGDVTNIQDKQIIVAAAEGAKAAMRVSEKLSR